MIIYRYGAYLFDLLFFIYCFTIVRLVGIVRLFLRLGVSRFIIMLSRNGLLFLRIRDFVIVRLFVFIALECDLRFVSLLDGISCVFVLMGVELRSGLD